MTKKRVLLFFAAMGVFVVVGGAAIATDLTSLPPSTEMPQPKLQPGHQRQFGAGAAAPGTQVGGSLVLPPDPTTAAGRQATEGGQVHTIYRNGRYEQVRCACETRGEVPVQGPDGGLYRSEPGAVSIDMRAVFQAPAIAVSQTGAPGSFVPVDQAAGQASIPGPNVGDTTN